MFATIQKWAGFVKFSHTIFALPFALASMLVAARDTRGWPGWHTFLLILGAMTAARTCAMSFNRIVDRRFDALNPRTASRDLPAGRVSLTGAIALCLFSAAAFVLCSQQLNPLCFALSPVALIVICFYSLTKRFTDYTHVFLGAALALAPVGAWLAVRGEFGFVPDALDPGVGDWIGSLATGLRPLVLAAAVIFWLIGFDIIYALQDYEFDRAHGLRSIVVAWGPHNALMASFLAHMATWALLVFYGLMCGFRVAYMIGMALIIVLLVMEHWIARRRALDWVNLAFFRLNALISVIFLVVVAIEVVFRGGFRMQR